MYRKTPAHDKLAALIDAQTAPFTCRMMINGSGCSETHTRRFLRRCAAAGAAKKIGDLLWVRLHDVPVPMLESATKPRPPIKLKKPTYTDGRTIINQALASQPLLVLAFDAAVRGYPMPEQSIAA